MLLFLTFFFTKESWKKNSFRVSTKILSSTTVFYIGNNKKCFLSVKHIRVITEASRDTDMT